MRGHDGGFDAIAHDAPVPDRCDRTNGVPANCCSSSSASATLFPSVHRTGEYRCDVIFGTLATTCHMSAEAMSGGRSHETS
ncbi:hypothetical protein [Burkholderia sp. Nafp2/4-1b]|uniref:hypothetical protein n=1 Tax=Burkholderia sp. Nafp2/4-1b TaxID=2116686 RepID=UPI0013CE506D|nr:hypothetical protein [Burkholderia sp. Nafp2/4-1b]